MSRRQPPPPTSSPSCRRTPRRRSSFLSRGHRPGGQSPRSEARPESGGRAPVCPSASEWSSPGPSSLAMTPTDHRKIVCWPFCRIPGVLFLEFGNAHDAPTVTDGARIHLPFYLRPRLFLADNVGVREAPEEEPRLCATRNHKAGRRLELLPHRQTYGPQSRNREVQGEQATCEVRTRPLHQRQLQRARLLDGALDNHSRRLLERRSGSGSWRMARPGPVSPDHGEVRGYGQVCLPIRHPLPVQEEIPGDHLCLKAEGANRGLRIDRSVLDQRAPVPLRTLRIRRD